MPFIRPPDPRRQKYGNLVTVSKINKSTGETRAMQIRLGEMIVSAKGWTAGQRFEVLWGHGTHFGMIRIERIPTGGVTLRCAKRKSMYWLDWATFPHVDLEDKGGHKWRFRREKASAVECSRCNLPGDALGIRLPREWFERVTTNHGNAGAWEEVDQAPRWSHQQVAQYDAVRERALRNP